MRYFRNDAVAGACLVICAMTAIGVILGTVTVSLTVSDFDRRLSALEERGVTATAARHDSLIIIVEQLPDVTRPQYMKLTLGDSAAIAPDAVTPLMFHTFIEDGTCAQTLMNVERQP